MPKVYVISLTGMSDKAMLHKAGIMVVEDDDGQPVPLDPLIEKLDDDKQELIEEMSNQEIKILKIVKTEEKS